MTTMSRAMPEATVLYSVTAVVVVALVIWVLVVLKTAKEPWSRPVAATPEAETPYRGLSEGDVPPIASNGAAPGAIDADSTARATPVALANDAKAKRTNEGA